MPEQLALEKTLEKALGPMQMIQRALEAAIEGGRGLEVIDRIFAQQRQMMEYNAKVEFDQAMQRAQSKVQRVGFDRNNPHTSSRYVTFAKLDAAIRPVYTEEGFSLSFDTAEIDKPDMVRVQCYVAHAGGHTRTYHIDMPADGKGAKGGEVMTRTHATGSAVSYGKRYLEAMIFNVTVGDPDDDGNAASGNRPGKSLDDKQHIVLLEGIQNAHSNAEITAAYIKAIKAAGAVGDQNSIAIFEREANKRKKELA